MSDDLYIVLWSGFAYGPFAGRDAANDWCRTLRKHKASVVPLNEVDSGRETIYKFVRQLRSEGADVFWGLDSDGVDDFQLDAIVARSLS